VANGVLDAVDWALLVAATVAAAVVSGLAAARRTRARVVGTAVLLGSALVLAALPMAPAPAGVVVAVAVAALVAAVAGGGPLTASILERTRFDEQEGAHGGLVDAATGRELLRGGRMIGLLERLAVAGSIVAGYPEALAVVIAVKGVGRFNELETSAVRERFIVGTFASWIWAAACACVVLLARS
jgi:hypothetical protein